MWFSWCGLFACCHPASQWLRCGVGDSFLPIGCKRAPCRIWISRWKGKEWRDSLIAFLDEIGLKFISDVATDPGDSDFEARLVELSGVRLVEGLRVELVCLVLQRSPVGVEPPPQWAQVLLLDLQASLVVHLVGLHQPLADSNSRARLICCPRLSSCLGWFFILNIISFNTNLCMEWMRLNHIIPGFWILAVFPDETLTPAWRLLPRRLNILHSLVMEFIPCWAFLLVPAVSACRSHILDEDSGLG